MCSSNARAAAAAGSVSSNGKGVQMRQ